MTNALPRGLPLCLIYLTSGDTRLPPRTRTATEGKFLLSTEMPVSSEKSALLGRIIITPSSPVMLLPFLLSESSQFLSQGTSQHGAKRSVFLLSPVRRLKRKQLLLFFDFPFFEYSDLNTSAPLRAHSPSKRTSRATFPFPTAQPSQQQPARSNCRARTGKRCHTGLLLFSYRYLSQFFREKKKKSTTPKKL